MKRRIQMVAVYQFFNGLLHKLDTWQRPGVVPHGDVSYGSSTTPIQATPIYTTLESYVHYLKLRLDETPTNGYCDAFMVIAKQAMNLSQRALDTYGSLTDDVMHWQHLQMCVFNVVNNWYDGGNDDLAESSVKSLLEDIGVLGD